MADLNVVKRSEMLERLVGASLSPEQIALGNLITSLFTPRFIRTDLTAIVPGDEDWGALFILTAASGITVTLSDSRPIGFMCSFLALTQPITYSGSDYGGTTVAAAAISTAMRIDDGSWVVGSAT